jgi:hypothetical protein
VATISSVVRVDRVDVADLAAVEQFQAVKSRAPLRRGRGTRQ